MKSLLLALLLVLVPAISFGAELDPEYTKVYIDTFGNGKPMLIYIGAEWCNPCKQMKAGPLAQAKTERPFQYYNYIELDVDKHRELIQKIKEGSKLPTLKIPHLLFVGRNGKVRILEGFTPYDTLDNALRTEATYYSRPVQP